MTDTPFHGIQILESADGARVLATAATAIIGIVATASDADVPTFPLNTPVLVTSITAAIAKAGTEGTLRKALEAIAMQTQPILVVVRVADGADATEVTANVIGTVTADGSRTGMQALLNAQAVAGVKPRILAAPGLDTLPVTTAFAIVAKKLRAMVYAKAVGATVAAAVTYRANFSDREVELIYGDLLVTGDDGASEVSYGPAHAIGLRAAIDQTQGFYKTLSNVSLSGVVGVANPVSWDITGQDSDAAVLNAAQITAIVRTDTGYRFWGNRTCSDDSRFVFESATRTAQVLLDTIGLGLLWASDKPLTPSLVKDLVETINGKLSDMKSAGQLIGGAVYPFDASKNSNAQLSAGQLALQYDYTPVPPLEQLGLTQTITDDYFADFATSLSS